MEHSFIDEERLQSLLDKKVTGSTEVKEILAKAETLVGLSVEEAAVLLNIDNEEDKNLLFETALKVKQKIYGNRMVLFAPLYVSNYCSNNCLYCGFRMDNKEMERRCLTIDEVKEEVRLILEQGHKRILMLMGEHPARSSFDYFLETIDAAYSVRDSKGSSIRRINVEIAPLSPEEFKKIATKKIGTYTVFQETYHRATYDKMHPSGKKKDFLWRLLVMDRALENGLHDVGIGALFGLYNWKFETLALLQHAEHLMSKYSIGPHTISIPRIEYAKNAPCAENVPHPVSDDDFMKIVAVLRCSVPYTGIILSTRESPQMRDKLIDLGVSQMSAGSRTDPGGYSADDSARDHGQFSLNDTRSTGEVIKSIIKHGYIPSFCTGCYRRGRVGKDFMDMAKPGLIKLHCQPNALLTLKEYLVDYADEETRKLGEALIEKELQEIPDEARKDATVKNLEKIEKGERDIYF
ncbi:MAG TPA: [FeFe] hydrogenase H-cluster radical SAM maturase HydG [Spirochaetota bacterium]|jgi:2-iminoacetate synthase|nr:[FeFe] hydrogenase H-cluster radical SAM maturase HydG [Spirochaetota bacterium]HOK93339.1 [FeFe] hydrogenase H-cluster radical SAM maturase HydG [Spirochaetota bacterium]HON17309.1 [FeFe] hydrogenase H-cluster radical SAM maturase HydG [Spirochaetota bacterium]HOQ11826.1 [FeFe] hydrogenase H-cluster radical SAM maturase HydG [Spirochaetota bacterium]HPD78367.1 [FeFe] hydrogenase H-cluster radical SAM maturase HydG [Spirochaetota bacterium]